MNDFARLVLVAEDDPDDRALIGDALADAGICATAFVHDGQELLDYLEKVYASRDAPERMATPCLILVDLNMPCVDGLAAIRQIRGDIRSNCVPLVVLSTSSAPGDIRRAYESGASAYVVKPNSYRRLVEVMRTLDQYWFKTVALPKPS